MPPQSGNREIRKQKAEPEILKPDGDDPVPLSAQPPPGPVFRSSQMQRLARSTVMT
jgi:hypothetical protein